MNIWHDIAEERISIENFCAVIEITKGSKTKYELESSKTPPYFFIIAMHAWGVLKSSFLHNNLRAYLQDINL